MYIRQINKESKKSNTTLWTIVGICAGIAITAAAYGIFNLSWGTPLGTSQYDTGTNKGIIPSIGDYLFGDASGELFSGDTKSGTIVNTGISLTGAITGDILTIYPTGYVDQFNKAVMILQNDSLVNTYVDTDNLTMSGYTNISINNIPNTVVSPKLLLQGKVSPTIENLYILGTTTNGAFLFEPINFKDNTWAFQLDPNNKSIQPGLNNYYIIGKREDNMYNIQYASVKTYEADEFSAVLDKICLLDLCSDPSLSKKTQANSTTILQQSDDAKTVIQIIPNISIIKGIKCANGDVALQQVKKIGDNYLRVSKGCDYESQGVSQSFVDKNNTPVTSSNANLGNIPKVLQFGNIKYIPTITFSRKPSPFTKINQINSNYIIKDILDKKYLENEYRFELPDNLFVYYTLDKTQLNYMRPSISNGMYKVIPKAASRMNKNIVYTVSSSDIGLHDTIVAHFKGSTISNPTNCSNAKPNDDPMAKFGIRPIDNNYDVVGFWNCYGVQ